MDALAIPWANVRAAHLLAVQRMTSMEVGNGQEEGYDTDEDNPLMYTQKAETLEPFSSCRSLVFSGTVHWFVGRQAFIHYCGLHQV